MFSYYQFSSLQQVSQYVDIGIADSNPFPRNYLGRLADTISPRWKVVRASSFFICAFAEYDQVGEYDLSSSA